DFHLVYGDESVTGIKTTRLKSLLAYLILHRNVPQPRQRLAFLFWPDASEEQARNNLRNLLHFLRRMLPESERLLLVDTQTIQWNPNAYFTLDVDQFTQAVAHSGRRFELQQAVSFYSGDLLPDCYDDWVQPEREKLREQFSGALERLIQRLEIEREYSLAITYAQRLLQVEPLREETHRQLMRLYAASGEKAKALHTYHSYVTLLKRELDVEPGPDIEAQYLRLLKNEGQSSHPRLSGTPILIGREKEWALLQSIWHTTTQRQNHFVLITGETGMGKTRLAEEMIGWAERQGIATATAHCFAAEGELSYAPITAWLRSRPLPALEEVWLSEIARILPEVLVEHPQLTIPMPLTENWQRMRLFKSLAQAVLKESSERILLIEDLQWCDRDTIEFIAYLLQTQTEISPETRLIVIGTLRIGEAAIHHPVETLRMDLHHSDQMTEIELEALNEFETIALAGAVIGQRITPEWGAKLFQETEGNPLFTVEMTRLLQGKETEKDLGNFSIPSKVQEVIQARLSPLTPDARELAEIAAVIGHQFTFSVLKKVAGGTEEHLVHSL
ncbi:MAG TPA: BTAD domain-containing putative transcriptional regulator, partial [Candidatus Paceibacterota bacterium]